MNRGVAALVFLAALVADALLGTAEGVTMGTFVAVAVGGASLVGGIASGVMASESQRKAQNKNLENAQNDRDLNYKMYRENRGSEGSSVLPLYFKDSDGRMFESEVMANDVMDLWNAGGSTADRMKQYGSIKENYMPMQSQARKAAGDVFSGATKQAMLADQAKVNNARLKLAGTRRQSGIDALHDTLAEIDAINTGRGFTGDGLAKQKLTLDARRDSYGAGAQAEAGATLQNAIDEKAISDYMRQLQLANLGLPLQMAGNDLNLSTLDESMLAESFARRMAPMQFFRIGAGNYQYEPLPTVQPIASPGQLVAQGVAQGAGAGLDYLLSQRAANNTRGPALSPVESNAYGSWYQLPDGGVAMSRTPDQMALYNATAAQYQ